MIQFYDFSNIHQLQWPNSEEAELAKRHLLPLIQEGPETFIQNAKTRLCLLMLDELIIPLSVNETEYHNCYLLSSYFVAAHLKERLEKSGNRFKFLSKPFVALFGALLKWMKINKVVIINNWLLTTNPYPELTKPQIKAITAFLKKRFPDHYFMFRSVNTYVSSTVYDALSFEHFRLIPCRQVYLYDAHLTSKLPPSVIRKQKKDTNRIGNKKYAIEIATSLTEEEIQRLLQLYRNVYVGKYTQYSPLYTEKFLRHALQNSTMCLKLLKKEGAIYGVAGFLQKNGYLLVPFFGYDTSLPQEEGLYRMLSAIIMEEIEGRNLISHQGSGAGQFKKWRGFIEHLEYVGIYDRHLPLFRRLFWTLSEKFSPLFLTSDS
jgi:hypothetical protein